MTSQIVGIHGMAKQQSGPRQLLLTWTAALGDGLQAAIGARPASVPSLDLAYYGDVFLPAPAPGSPVTMGSGPDRSEFADLDDGELAELLATAEETFGADELADAAHRTEMGVSAVPKPLQAVLRVLDRRFGMAGAVLHIGVLRQVRRYLADRATGSRVDPRIVTTADGCRVLVAHSLGSVVGYRYLQQNPGHGVELFLTLGSPLGLRMVRDRLDVRPLGVPHWVNIRDLRDPVACAGDLSTWWPQVQDGFVVNGADAHAVERYLGKRTTGQALLKVFPEAAA